MGPKEFSITRTHATWKPRVDAADLPFFRCNTCGTIMMGVAGSVPSTFSEPGRAPVAEPAYLSVSAPSCCGHEMEPLPMVAWKDVPESIELDYQFVGGFNNNCLKIKWSIDAPDTCVEWACIKTFTGMQLKYALPKKRSPLLFAFADEDAFCYCDKNPCIECKFRCKAGMVAYVGVSGVGVVRMPLERMATPIPSSSDPLTNRP
jgi:hypothetical protein